MHGNALEWVQDMYHGDYGGASSDGSVWGVGMTSTGSFGAVAGRTSPGAAGRRIATAVPQASATTAYAFGFYGERSHFPLHHIHTMKALS